MGRAGADSITWRLNREIIVVAGWGRAILLQLAHPLVAAGVDQHSTFRGSLASSSRRLWSTVNAMLRLTFGTEEEVITAAAAINGIHDRVSGRLAESTGVFPSGHRYSAHDPELLRWVHATLLDSVPLTYELLVGPLTPAERDRYCLESTVMEPLLDIPAGSLPRNRREADACISEALASGRIAVSDRTRALARAVLFPPRWQLLWPFFRPVQLITIGLLPASVRDAYGFSWSRRDARAFKRWTATLRVLRRLVPPAARQWTRAAHRPVRPAARPGPAPIAFP